MKIGVIIENGPQDWQILQQKLGYCEIQFGGCWVPLKKTEENQTYAMVYARVVKEETGDTVIPWSACETWEDGTWKGTLSDIPTGGLYRIETCLEPRNGAPIEWCTRGDMIHHIGVGDLYVISGQSNSASYGKNPIFDPPEIGIHVLRNNGRWDLASHPLNDSTDTIHEENCDESNTGHSPYISFARQLKRELGYPIGLLQSALGGSSLRAWNPAEDGVLYRNMVNIIHIAGGNIRGILWYQGCSDCLEGLCDTYLERFENMVSSLRNDIGCRDLPILTVQLNRLASLCDEQLDIYWGKVREAQRQAAKRISGVYVIPAIDCSLSDLIHNSSASNIVIGERLAKIALANIYGRKCIHMAPDISSAGMGGCDTLKLTFDNVSGRIDTLNVGPLNLPFTVIDEKGRVAITGYDVIGRNIILLKLERPLDGKSVIHGAYETNPQFTIPHDIDGYLPMLAFYGVAIQQS